MNKSDLIEAFTQAEGLTIKKADAVINTVFGSVEQALIRGERVEIRGFAVSRSRTTRVTRAVTPRPGRS